MMISKHEPFDIMIIILYSILLLFVIFLYQENIMIDFSYFLIISFVFKITLLNVLNRETTTKLSDNQDKEDKVLQNQSAKNNY